MLHVFATAVRLLFSAEFPTHEDAFRAERQIKGWSRRKKRALIDGDWGKLVEYSKKHVAVSLDHSEDSGWRFAPSASFDKLRRSGGGVQAQVSELGGTTAFGG